MTSDYKPKVIVHPTADGEYVPNIIYSLGVEELMKNSGVFFLIGAELPNRDKASELSSWLEDRLGVLNHMPISVRKKENLVFGLYNRKLTDIYNIDK